ncbi:MAG TPA: adenylyl-sulfate kinase [Vicinamibacterales bacterium]|nr:adenylyl-sulfate kinase [Vicinamibacterales bacterium]
MVVRRGAVVAGEQSGTGPSGAIRLVPPTPLPERYAAQALLRFTTAGSVDDGKSTLIGRLLYDADAVLEDQLAAVERASRHGGEHAIDFALFTDGLRAEREQRITIDVAYRYFATPRRAFIIADTPGHTEYTRNMVTGASTADLAIIMVDARKGLVTQSKRHGFIATLLRIPYIVVAVNKMDLVDYREDVFARIAAEYRDFAGKLGGGALVFVPISALHGDNVTRRSDRMPWYAGPTLLHQLETVPAGADRNLVDFRLPVQHVVRPDQDYRGVAGRIASGTIAPGEEVVALPSGRATRVRAVDSADGPMPEAIAGDSVVLTLDDDIDLGRGGMLVRRNNLPVIGTRIDAVLCWLDDAPLDLSLAYRLQHTTRSVQASITRLVHRIDVDTLHRSFPPTLEANDIGRVEITTAAPVFHDPYSRNRQTGSFVLVHPFTNATVAAGMIRGAVQTADEVFGRGDPHRTASPDVTWEPTAVSREDREVRHGHKAAVLWFTGLSGSGKSTIARRLERRLFDAGCSVQLLDGDRLRHGLCGDLGFSPADRHENNRRAAELAWLGVEQGDIVVCALVSPYAEDRARARARLQAGRFIEVFVDCPIAECIRRDPKGLYRRALAGEIPRLTGISDPYEPPEHPEFVARTDCEQPEEIVERLLEHLQSSGILPWR